MLKFIDFVIRQFSQKCRCFCYLPKPITRQQFLSKSTAVRTGLKMTFLKFQMNSPGTNRTFDAPAIEMYSLKMWLAFIFGFIISNSIDKARDRIIGKKSMFDLLKLKFN